MTMRWILASLVLLAACGEGTVDAEPGGEPGRLAGRTFVGTDVTGHDLVAGTELRLVFKAGEVNVNAGCNHLFGNYELDGETLKTDRLGGTDMGCDPQRMDQDTWISEFLSSGPKLTVSDQTLTLAKGAVTVRLTDEKHVQAQNPIPLEGTTWVLESAVEGDSVSSIPGKPPTLRMDGGDAEVFTGCNRGRGTVSVDEDTLVFGSIATTKMACPDAPYEAVVLAVLAGEVSYEQDYDSLTLSKPDTPGLVFKAQTR